MLPKDDATRQSFDTLKAAVAETYYSTEPGMKEMGWAGNVAFAPTVTITGWGLERLHAYPEDDKARVVRESDDRLLRGTRG